MFFRFIRCSSEVLLVLLRSLSDGCSKTLWDLMAVAGSLEERPLSSALMLVRRESCRLKAIILELLLLILRKQPFYNFCVWGRHVDGLACFMYYKATKFFRDMSNRLSWFDVTNGEYDRFALELVGEWFSEVIEDIGRFIVPWSYFSKWVRVRSLFLGLVSSEIISN
jgi:hypothetical protein